MNKKRITSLLVAVIMVLTLLGGYVFADGTYTVKSGDVLWKIGKELGLDWKELAEYNDIKDPSRIYPGQTLNIPSETTEEYTTEDLNEQLVMATLWMQKSAEYRSLCYQAFNMAKMLLDNDLANNTSDMPRAIVVDADETVIDNSAYEAHLVGKDYGYSSSTWNPWMDAAEAKAIPGALEFLTYAKEKGVEIFYITNRKMVGYDGTVKNLKDLGFPDVDEKHMLLRTGSSDKEERRQIVTSEYRVVLYMGDNLNDFSSEFGKKSVEERFAATDANKDKFGIEWIVLPNPTYGEWEGAIYDYNWGASAEEKDEMRKEKLIKWDY